MKSILFLTLLLLGTSVLGGRIFPWGEPFITYPNKGMVSMIDLYFSMETALPANNVIRVTFPFTTQLSIASAWVFPTSVSRGNSQSLLTPAISSGGVQLTGLQQTSSTPFNNWWVVSSNLLAATNYILRITLTASTSPSDGPAFLGYIQMETMSPANSVISQTAGDIPITYDLNNAFAALHMFEAPGNPAYSAPPGTDPNIQVAGATVIRQFKFSPSKDFWYWPLITITWDNPGFTFSNCINADIGNSSTATPLPAALYTCTITTNTGGGMITILHNNFLQKNNSVVYNLTVNNPSGSTQNTANTYLRIQHRWNQNISDFSASPVQLTVNAQATSAATAAVPAIADHRVLLSWGLD